MPSNVAVASRLAQRIETRTTELGPALRVFRVGRALNASERHDLEHQVAALDADLRGTVEGTSPLIEWVVEFLHGAFKARRDQGAYSTIADSFMMALDGRPAALIREAVRRINGAEVPAISKTFMPTAAEVAGLVRELEAEWMLQRTRLASLLALQEERPAPPPAPLSAADAERLAAVRDRLRSGSFGRRKYARPPARSELPQPALDR